MAWYAAPREARASTESVPGDGECVFDVTGLTLPSTRVYLNGWLGRLEAQTGIKFRVICPPPGLQNQRDEWREYLRPISKKWGLDQGSVVITAELKVDSKRGLTKSGLMRASVGQHILERFQYTFNNDFVTAVSNRFGSSSYVDSNGTDQAIRDATENIIAGLFSITDLEKDRGKDKGPFSTSWYRSYVPADDVSTILARHA